MPRALLAQTDVIRGRVTNAEGQPLANVLVTATSVPGNVTQSRRTNADGRFQFAVAGGTGDYIMGYSLVGYTFRQIQVKRIADQDVLVADARMGAVQLDTVSITAAVQQRVNRNQPTPDIGGGDRPINLSDLPADLLGNVAALAASLPGVTLVPGLDGSADGFSVLGLGADQNSVMLNGVSFDGNGLPRDASVSTNLSTSPFDGSRGGFSGGQVNISSRTSNSNFRTRGVSMVVNVPELQWTDPAARALGSEFTNISIGGRESGPLKQNKSFYNISYELARRSNANASLLNTGALGLQTAGVSIDSVGRFLGILGTAGIPQRGGPTHQSRFSDRGSLLGSLSITPPNSSSGTSYSMSFNANWNRSSPAGGGATSLISSTGERSSWGGGVQGSFNRYLGMILSETNFGLNTSQNDSRPYLDLPGGRVRVNSDLENGASGVQSLAFGGAQSFSTTSRSTSASVDNTLRWFDNANKHSIRLTTQLQYTGQEQDLSNNLLGTFSFNSLEDLEQGRAASYSRQLAIGNQSTKQYNAAISITDSWRRSQDLQLSPSLRIEKNYFGDSPAFNPEVQELFGRRNDFVPRNLGISPRIGFTWTRGASQEIAFFEGAARRPRTVIQGGTGLFINATNAGTISAPLTNTGLPSSAQQLLCTGDATPVPDWRSYAANPGSVPDRCADGTSGTVFSNSAPNVSLVSRDFVPQRSIRSDLSWSRPVLDGRFQASVRGSHSINLNQQQTVDINFVPDVKFDLASEGGRPVFVAPTSIAPATGAIASRDARASQKFSRVSELRSDLRSQSMQASISLSPIQRTPSRFGWSATYTYLAVQEQFTGFNSNTAGSPLAIETARNSNGPHQINYTLRYNFFDYVRVTWSGNLRSGARYTPVVGGDVNGDGSSNDRAFVFDPANAGDAALASGMRQLIDNSSGAARECLLRQVGRIAARNSCTAPWSNTGSINISLDRAKFHMPQRAQVDFSLSNPLGAADLAFNGSGNLRGWGQSPFPDQSLLYVRGFDPSSNRYKYEVNQRFGATRPQFLTLRSPVSVTLNVRYDIGRTRERQQLVQQLNVGRAQPGQKLPEVSFRSQGTFSVSNPMSTILRSQDSLRLTAVQADSIASMNRRFTYRADSIWTGTARFLAALPVKYDADLANDRFMRARRAQIDLLIDAVKAIREMLTPAQLRKLPPFVTTAMDPRYLESIRNGSGLYVGGTTSQFFGGEFTPIGVRF
ncbi:MAG: TonB-dependent receptor [Gemmatimonadota bacterium]